MYGAFSSLALTRSYATPSRTLKNIPGSRNCWRDDLKVVAVALANKMARVAWVLLAKGGTYYRAQALATVVTAAA